MDLAIENSSNEVSGKCKQTHNRQNSPIETYSPPRKKAEKTLHRQKAVRSKVEEMLEQMQTQIQVLIQIQKTQQDGLSNSTNAQNSKAKLSLNIVIDVNRAM